MQNKKSSWGFGIQQRGGIRGLFRSFCNLQRFSQAPSQTVPISALDCRHVEDGCKHILGYLLMSSDPFYMSIIWEHWP